MSRIHPSGASRTVLFQPPNHIGLGHVNRLSAIALALRRIDSSIRTPFVVEGGSHVLLEALGLPYVLLPSSHEIHETDCWAAWTKQECSALVTEISRAILTATNPQVVVFDCLPNRAFLATTIERKSPIVLCLREMRELNRYLDCVRDLLPHIHTILIPHDVDTFTLPPELSQKAHCVGLITRGLHHRPASTEKRDGVQIVITGGGGGYPGTAEFYNLAMKAVSELRCEYPKMSCRLIAGPLFSEWRDLRHEAGITVIPFEVDTFTTFAEADLVIAQAGYNTVAELASVETQTILVPADREWDDQFGRAQQAVRTHSHFKALTKSSPDGLKQLAFDCLRNRPPDRHLRPFDGAERAATRLCSLLDNSSGTG